MDKLKLQLRCHDCLTQCVMQINIDNVMQGCGGKLYEEILDGITIPHSVFSFICKQAGFGTNLRV